MIHIVPTEIKECNRQIKRKKFDLPIALFTLEAAAQCVVRQRLMLPDQLDVRRWIKKFGSVYFVDC